MATLDGTPTFICRDCFCGLSEIYLDPIWNCWRAPLVRNSSNILYHEQLQHVPQITHTLSVQALRNHQILANSLMQCAPHTLAKTVDILFLPAKLYLTLLLPSNNIQPVRGLFEWILGFQFFIRSLVNLHDHSGLSALTWLNLHLEASFSNSTVF